MVEGIDGTPALSANNDKQRWLRAPSSASIENVFPLTIDLDPSQYGEADRREVDPPVEVEAATWAAGGTLDWWVKEHRPRTEWYGRVRGPDGRQQWIKPLIFVRNGDDSLRSPAMPVIAIEQTSRA